MLRFRGLVLGAVVIAVGLAAWTVLIGPRDPAPLPAAVQPVAIARDYVRSGRNLLAQQRLPEAYTAFQEAVRLAPDLADGYRGLAAAAYDQGAVIEAVGHLERVAELYPTDGRPFRMIGHICADLDKREDAVTALRKALARSLTPAAERETHEELAEQLLKLGEAEAALAQLPEQAKPADDSIRSLAVRAEATWSTSGPDAAIDVLEEAIPNRPAEPQLLSLLGRLRVDRGDYAEAVAPLEEGVRLDRTDLTTLQALATAYQRLDRSADAERVRRERAEVQKALERLTSLTVDADAQPWNAAIREELAAICESLGKRSLAAMWRHAAAEARKITPADLKN